jgi:uncharacterized membrane protein
LNWNFSTIGAVHTLLCLYVLWIGAIMLWRAKGNSLHRSSGRRYLFASTLSCVSALMIYPDGTFNIFHVIAVVTLMLLAIGFGSAHSKVPKRKWLRIHITTIVLSYYMMIGGLINEAFVRITSLRGHGGLAAGIHSAGLIAILMVMAYFYGRTAHAPISAAAEPVH